MSLIQSSTESVCEKKNRQKCPGISEIELSKNDLYFQNISPFSNSAGGLYVLVTQSCPTLCHPMDCSPPGSSVLGISQARIQEWVAIPFSRGSSQCWGGGSNPDLPPCKQILYLLRHQGSPAGWLHAVNEANTCELGRRANQTECNSMSKKEYYIREYISHEQTE